MSTAEPNEPTPRRFALESLARDVEELRATIRLFVVSDIALHGVTRIQGSSACRALEAFGSNLLDELIEENEQQARRDALAAELADLNRWPASDAHTEAPDAAR